MHLLTPILPYLDITNVGCQMPIYVKNAKNAKNAIFDTYAIRHMSYIEMAIWVSKDVSGPQECRPMP